jgi:hypothetical protein
VTANDIIHLAKRIEVDKVHTDSMEELIYADEKELISEERTELEQQHAMLGITTLQLMIMMQKEI